LVRHDVMRAFSRLIKRLLFAMSLNAERTKVESGKQLKLERKREKENLIVDKENESLQNKDKLKKNMLTQ
jgi:hypothetical protein